MTDSTDSHDRNILRLWLQMLKFTLPIRRHVNIELRRECGHSLTRFDVLAQLSEFGEQTVGGLAQNLINSSGNIASLLDRMELLRLVERQVDSDDARTFIIKISEKGSRLYKHMLPVHTRIVDGYLGRIDEDTRQSLIDLLKSGRSAMCRD